MKNEQGKPQFRLVRILQRGSEPPLVFPVDGPVVGDAARLPDRRAFLRLGAGIPAAAAMAAFWTGRAEAADSVIVAHHGAVVGLVISQDGKTLLSSSVVDGMKKWNLPEGSLAGQFQITGVVRGTGVMALSANGRDLAVSGINAVWIAHFPEGESSGALLLGSELPVGKQLTSIAYSPDGRWMATSEGTEVLLSSIPPTSYATLQVTRRLEGRSDAITHLAIAGVAGGLLVSGSRDGRLCTWRFPQGDPVAQFDTGAAISAMLPVARGEAIATGHADGTIVVTSLADGKSTMSVKADARIVALALGPGGSLVSAAADGTIDVWSLPGGDRQNTVKLELSGAAAPGATTLVGRKTATPAVPLGPLTAMAVTTAASGALVAVGGRSGQIVLLDWPALTVRTHLFDRRANPVDAKGVSFTVLDRVTGRTVTYTLPCGSEIPPGATCVCNCVPGTGVSPTYVPPSIPVTVPSPGIYNPSVTVPGSTITRPCTPEPVPPGYSCTCNCIPGQ